MGSASLDVPAGVLAAAAGLGAAELLAGAVPTGRSPVVAVGDEVIRLAPGSVARAAIDALGTADKPALVLAVLVVVLALGGLAGRLARHPAVSLVLVAGAAALGAAAAMAAEDATWVHGLPAVVGGAVAAWVLRLLRRAADAGTAPLPPAAADRRRFLLAGTTVGAMTAIAGTTGRLLQGRVDASASRRAVALPAPSRHVAALPQGAELGVPGITPRLTPNDDFYRIDVSLVLPQVETDGWELRVGGMVDHPLTFTYQDLLDRPLVEAEVTLACVSNQVGGGLVGNARWLGVPLRELLEEAGVQARADQVVGRAVDGFTTGFPVAAALDGRDALVAIGMNGEPLPIRHGFPARLVVAGLYGYVSATKWLEEIELTRFDAFDPYWVRRGWSRLGPVKLASRIDTPGRKVAPGRVPVAGVAWAQGRGIRRVEVRVDDGRWHEAELAAPVGDDTWRQWRWDWDATKGRHELSVRATAGDGEVQTRDRALVFPDGATGWHRVRVSVG